MKTRKITVSLSSEAHEKLIEAAMVLGLSPTAMARMMILKALLASFKALDEVRA